MIKKVFVVHKTHLDIGFTDSAANVLQQYLDRFIPQAIRTAYACNRDGKRNFVWTTGAFLIEYYLEHAADPEPLIRAIRDGYIAWHGLALTTHTELMDERLFRDELEISRRLDKRFGRTTIAAKMTDVPGHTIAMVPCLAEYGIRYLHVGINSASKTVKLPPLCRLRYGGAEIVLNYTGAYGGADTFGEYALEFAHTADNMGPPTPERVQAEILRLQQKYPGAEIVSSTIDEFAREVLKRKDSLPVVDEELGDTWIHGGATDPYKVGAYCELLRLRDRWLAADPAAAGLPAYREMVRNLMLVCEHTWGRDSKRWLSDYKNWSKADFRAARARDQVTPGDVLPAGEPVAGAALEQQTMQTGRCRYSAMEESWQEQREYVSAALAELPEPWQSEGRRRLAALRPAWPAGSGQSTADRQFSIRGYAVQVEPDGALRVTAAPGRQFSRPAMLGRLAYCVYDAADVSRNLETYNRDLDRTRVWAAGDFAKPGLDRVEGLRAQRFVYRAVQVERDGDSLYIRLEAPQQAAETYGAPRRALVACTFGEEISLRLQWFEKDASRIPEAVFWDMEPGDGGEPLCIWKMGRPVDPRRVREGGNRKLHAAPRFRCSGMEVESLHAPVLSVGGEHLYDEDENYGPAGDGVAWLLYNNRWNTNFRLWYEENASFEFRVRFQGAQEGNNCHE